MLPRRHRLGTREFQKVYEEGDVRQGNLLVLRVRYAEDSPGCWGFAVGRKLAPLAVDRSRWKRRLRAVAREFMREGMDVVVTARPRSLRASREELRSEIEKLLEPRPRAGQQRE